MSNMVSNKKIDFTFCVADMYVGDTYVTSVKIWGHNIEESYIEIQSTPLLTVGKLYNVLIRTSPDPTTFKGRVRNFRGRMAIMLFGGNQEIVIKGTRQAPRIRTNIAAHIEGSIYSNKLYPLHTKTEVTIVDISKGGGRLQASPDCVRAGDKLLIKLNEKIADISTLFLEVLNCDEKQEEYAEYGCRFIVDAEIYTEPTADRIKRELNAEVSAYNSQNS